jgi:hypothetical protein
MKLHVITLLGLLTGVAPAPAYQQSMLPDLSGAWKLNAAKSSMPGYSLDPIRSLQYKITQSVNKIILDIVDENGSNRYEYVADGKPRVSGVLPQTKTQIITRALWEKEHLILVSHTEDGTIPELTSRFTLSKDGKVLSVRKIAAGLDGTLVFEKQ